RATSRTRNCVIAIRLQENNFHLMRQVRSESRHSDREKNLSISKSLQRKGTLLHLLQPPPLPSAPAARTASVPKQIVNFPRCSPGTCLLAAPNRESKPAVCHLPNQRGGPAPATRQTALSEAARASAARPAADT